MRTFLLPLATAVATTAAVAASAAAAPPTASDILSVRSRAEGGEFAARAEWMATTFYLQGAIEAFATANATEKLFCPPEGKSYSIDEMVAFLEGASTRDRTTPALDIILDGYRAQHPCRDDR